MTIHDVQDLRQLAERAREKQQRVAISPEAAERIADELESHLSGDTSDGHHTFDELYDYRMLYNAHAAHGWLAAGIPVVKSWRHSDGELCFGGGWFIVTATLPAGQVSNHYKAEHWDLFAVPAVDLPPAYDGHTPTDAAARLRAAALFAQHNGQIQREDGRRPGDFGPLDEVGGIEPAEGVEKVGGGLDDVGVGHEFAEADHDPSMRATEREALANALAHQLGPDYLGLAEGTGALHVALSESIRATIEDVYADCGDSEPGVLSSNIAMRLASDLPPAILALRPTTQGEPAERDIEYRDGIQSSDWVLAVAGASDRDVSRALKENDLLGWQKYRVSAVEPDSESEPSDADERGRAHCSPALLAYGLDCASTPRRACACEPANGGHDHLLPQRQGKPLDAKLEWPDHWTMNEKLRDLHARWHDQPGNLIGPGACGWEGCEFWHSAQFALRLADAKMIGRDPQGEPADARGEAEALYPLDRGDPDTIIALRSAYRAGVDREGSAALRAAAATQGGSPKRVLMTHPHDGHGEQDTCRDCQRTATQEGENRG